MKTATKEAIHFDEYGFNIALRSYTEKSELEKVIVAKAKKLIGDFDFKAKDLLDEKLAKTSEDKDLAQQILDLSKKINDHNDKKKTSGGLIKEYKEEIKRLDRSLSDGDAETIRAIEAIDDNILELTEGLAEAKQKLFENTANLYSLSDTAKFGGKIGWVKENQLTKEILLNLQDLKIGEHTAPINVPGGILILFLKNKRQAKMELSFDDELKKIINIERNRQLDQYSSIYYKKVEINTKIYDY